MLNFFQLILIYAGVYAIMAIGQNCITGYTGMLSLCHAGFFCIGSYATAIMCKIFGLSFWLSLPAAAGGGSYQRMVPLNVSFLFSLCAASEEGRIGLYSRGYPPRTQVTFCTHKKSPKRRQGDPGPLCLSNRLLRN